MSYPINKKKDFPIQSNSKTCSFYLQKKKRFCHLLVCSNQRYCGQHLVNEKDPNINHRKRIPCPLDSKHSIFESKLENHLKTCNAREKILPYSTKGINDGEFIFPMQSTKQFKNLEDYQLISYLNKVENSHKEFVGELVVEIENHVALNESLSNEEFGPSVLRHLKQNASIVGHLNKMNLLDDLQPISFLEFGAGRGQLTKWIIDAMANTKNSKFILIDRGAQRHKFDTKLKYVETLDIKRVRIDIKDLDIKKLDVIKFDSNIVASGKHLCGAATDFTLRCLTPEVKRLKGIVIALCCHHQCTWQSYVGKEFLEKLGFTYEDFSVLLSLTSWAVSSFRAQTEHDHKPPVADNDGETHEIKENRYQRLGLTVEKREDIGRKAKQLVDWGRIEYLRGLNLSTRLIQYVSTTETLENIALIAYPKEK